jgi:hypothetical protein
VLQTLSALYSPGPCLPAQIRRGARGLYFSDEIRHWIVVVVSNIVLSNCTT